MTGNHNKKHIPEHVADKGGKYHEAVTEQQEFADDKLEKEARKLQHHRREGIRNIVHQSAMILIMVSVLILLLMMVIWAWHVLTPWGYLTEERLEDLRNMLFSGALAALVSDYARKNI